MELSEFSKNANEIFQGAIQQFHVLDYVEQPLEIPGKYSSDSIEFLLFKKCWIDTVQWHLEDIIRDPEISPDQALLIKRRIDHSNQERTDLVEFIDSFFLNEFKNITPNPDASINTESPAWAIDRLSILALKIFHMAEEANRLAASSEHKSTCKSKLSILLEQRLDLSLAIDNLLNEISSGNKYMKVYKQMKMYNDDELNPVLRAKK